MGNLEVSYQDSLIQTSRSELCRPLTAGDQKVVITSGRGCVQQENSPIQEVHPGDIVWFPPGVKHWHGAAPATAMTHVAIQERLDGEVVDWLEPVSDKQYRGGE